MRYVIEAKEEQDVVVNLKMDRNIWEINGPHFVSIDKRRKDYNISFSGITNEGRNISMYVAYRFSERVTYQDGMFYLSKHLNPHQTFTLRVYAYIVQDEPYSDDGFKVVESISLLGFHQLYRQHTLTFEKKWKYANVDVMGDEQADFELKYSIYHLLILEDEESLKSIPARGLSGQVYKGAIFWDTEIFMLPFYTLTNPMFARNLIQYRINTLLGALAKAKELGYEGAFYAWESQEDGLERCSKFNVTDPITGEPIRTYFNEKQIHISADIVLAMSYYLKWTNDYSILRDGGFEVMYQVVRFFMSYANNINGIY